MDSTWADRLTRRPPMRRSRRGSRLEGSAPIAREGPLGDWLARARRFLALLELRRKILELARVPQRNHGHRRESRGNVEQLAGAIRIEAAHLMRDQTELRRL